MHEETVIGKVGILPRGDYSSMETYEINDLVQHDGGTYLYRHPTPSSGTPVTDTSKWMEVFKASSGAAALADTIFNDITTNPYLIQFDTLDQVTTTGYWNQESQRIEC